MKIEVRLFATFTQYLPDHAQGQKAMLEFPDGTSVREVLQDLGVPLETVKLVFINGVHAKLDDIVQDGDRVGAFPPVAGG